MIDSLETLATAAISNALVATLLAVPAFLASRWARPTVAHALWLLVLVKLVTPPLFETRVTLPAALAFGGSSPAAINSQVTGATEETHAAVDIPASAAQLPLPREVPATTPSPEAFEETSPRELISDQAAMKVVSPPILDPFVVGAIENDTQLVVTPPRPAADMQMPVHVPALDEAGAWDAASTEDNVVCEPFIPSIERDNNAADLIATSNANTVDAPLATSTSIGTSSEVLATSATDPATSAAMVLLIVWAAGAIGWCLLAIARIVRFRRALRHAAVATPPLQAEVAALAAQIELRRVPETLIVPGQISPLVCTPLGRAVLILPRDLLARFTDEQRSAVIAHELAHLRRRDHWTRWLELVAIGLYWWLPTVWIARRLLHQAEEACCDAWVVWLLPQRSRDYARALLETIDFLTPAPDAPLLSSGFGRASTLKRRFDMILRQHASHRLSWPARVGIAAAGLMVLPWSLTTLAADDPTTPPATKTAPVVANDENPPSAGNPPSGLPSTPTPPRAENGAPELPPVAPRADAPRADATPPTGVPSLPPSASSAARLTPPLPSAQATAPGALPTPSVDAPPTLGPPSSQPAIAPPTPTDPSPYRPGAGAPPTAEPLGPPATTPIPGATPVVPRGERGTGDPRVLARLERLEATTAELLMLVKQLRDERQPGPKSYRGVKDVPAKEYSVPSQFGMRYGHGDKQLLIEVAGREVSASDVATGKVMWTTAMPWNVNAVQSANKELVASGFNGGQAVIDPNNGTIKVTNVPVVGNYGGGDSRPAKTTLVDPAADSNDAKSAEIAAKRAQEVMAIEMDMLALERKLSQERTELQHRVRQMETRRARLARKLDSLPAETSSDERAKLTAELEEAEDVLASIEHEADVFEADLEFKVREIQLKRDQLLRSQGFDPREASPARAQPKRASALIQR